MSEHMMPIPSRLYNAAVGGHVAGADQIIDDETGLTLDKITGGALEEKEYTSGSDNGMGRVVLRKNLVEGVNTLTQTMINKSNTIYIIQYDFTLGENITIPANCVLEFDGGSISNGTINPNSCKVIGEKGIFNGVTFNGWFNCNVSFEWFLDEDFHNVIQSIIDYSLANLLDTCFLVPEGTFKMTGLAIRTTEISDWSHQGTISFVGLGGRKSIIDVNDEEINICNRTKLIGITIIGGLTKAPIKVGAPSNLYFCDDGSVIQNCFFNRNKKGCIDSYDYILNFKLIDCKFIGNKNTDGACVKLTGNNSTTIKIIGNYFSNNQDTKITINTGGIGNVIITNNIIESSSYGDNVTNGRSIKSSTSANTIIENNYFELFEPIEILGNGCSIRNNYFSDPRGNVIILKCGNGAKIITGNYFSGFYTGFNPSDGYIKNRSGILNGLVFENNTITVPDNSEYRYEKIENFPQNLLLDSSFALGTRGTTLRSWATLVTDDGYKDNYCIHLNRTTNDSRDNLPDTAAYVTNGKRYIYSFYAKKGIKNTLSVLMTGVTQVTELNTFYLTDYWKRYEIEFYASENGNISAYYDDECDCYIDDIQFEQVNQGWASEYIQTGNSTKSVRIPKRTSGSTTNRPILGVNDAGDVHFDTNLGKDIVWSGTVWKNVDGSPLT